MLPRWFVCGLLMAWALLGGGPHGRAETAAPAPGETPLVDAAAIAGWIDDLDNDRYAVREAAHYRLVAAGSAALLDVGQAAAGGVLESSTRAVNILLQWAQSDDGALSLGALEQLAALTNRPVEARMASERLAAVREADALRKIAQLGGRFPFDPMTAVISGAGANAPLQVDVQEVRINPSDRVLRHAGVARGTG
ncbi:MAG TPA: hypothetical protein PJ982_10765 [Lacipirellulaceae bacterium]|nr:hypothetical protein [Lacipirellulaceae bacterium]